MKATVNNGGDQTTRLFDDTNQVSGEQRMQNLPNINFKTCRTVVMVAGVLAFTLQTLALAVESPGTLTSVSITDSLTANTPPSAVFTYSQNIDGSYTFDAGGSYDPDGNITDYKWNFGDEITGSGSKVTHKFLSAAPLNVTLQVVDDVKGLSITKKNIVPEAWLKDEFDEATTTPLTNHVSVTGGRWEQVNITEQNFSITGGYGSVVNTLTEGDIAINNATPTKNDYTVSVTGTVDSPWHDRLIGACGRFDETKKTGYCAYLTGTGNLSIAKYNDTSNIYGTIMASRTLPIDWAATYTLSLSFSGSTLKAQIPGIDPITIEDTSYPEGKSGFILRRNNSKIFNIESKY